jgi:hypothetical protein
MFKVFTVLSDGEYIFVSSRNDLGQAMQLVQNFRAIWPREYVISDSDGKDMTTSPPMIRPKLLMQRPSNGAKSERAPEKHSRHEHGWITSKEV